VKVNDAEFAVAVACPPPNTTPDCVILPETRPPKFAFDAEFDEVESGGVTKALPFPPADPFMLG
jgi:hypothetical protein